MMASPGEIKTLTQDREIKCLRWLLIDLDPIRWAGISSSAEELQAAEELGAKIAKKMESEWQQEKGIRAMSGNGIHIMYRLPDLANKEENVAFIRATLATIAEEVRDDRGDVDLSVFNPARIWKLYGTSARKGDSVKDRPHRVSYVYPRQPKKLADVPVCQQINPS